MNTFIKIISKNYNSIKFNRIRLFDNSNKWNLLGKYDDKFYYNNINGEKYLKIDFVIFIWWYCYVYK